MARRNYYGPQFTISLFHVLRSFCVSYLCFLAVRAFAKNILRRSEEVLPAVIGPDRGSGHHDRGSDSHETEVAADGHLRPSLDHLFENDPRGTPVLVVGVAKLLDLVAIPREAQAKVLGRGRTARDVVRVRPKVEDSGGRVGHLVLQPHTWSGLESGVRSRLGCHAQFG